MKTGLVFLAVVATAAFAQELTILDLAARIEEKIAVITRLAGRKLDELEKAVNSLRQCGGKMQYQMTTINECGSFLSAFQKYLLKMKIIRFLRQLSTRDEPKLPTCVFGAVDLAVIMDESVSISSEDFKKARSAVSHLVESLKKSNRSTGNRVGYVGFSSVPKLHFKLTNDFNRAQKLIRKVKKMEGMTNIASAMRMAREQVLGKATPNKDATKIMVLVTDGLDTTDDHATENIRRESKLAEKSGITVYALGVGKMSDEQLKVAAGSPDRFLVIENYSKLQKALVSVICHDK